MRLDRLLANLGYGSRSEVRALIAGGAVTLQGRRARDPSASVDPRAVTIAGEPLDHPAGVLVAVHKPSGYACSHDERERPLVYDLLPDRWRRRNPQVVSVGRLDRDTSGVLLVTDHHRLVHDLTSPKRHVEKVYVATLDAPLTADQIVAFASGTLVLSGEDRPCRPAAVEPRPDVSPTAVQVTLTEGRYHQVRRMFAAVGRHVSTLHRERFGSWSLGDLPPGAWTDLADPDSAEP